MHYSRVFTPKDATYSAASAVLLNELLKGGISFGIALTRIETVPGSAVDPMLSFPEKRSDSWQPSERSQLNIWTTRIKKLGREVFSPDCWKLSIPAILYVIQNNLQFVAASNLDVATFQVTYQMKILTTAAFSVLMLRKRLSSTKWIALLLLAIGVGIVQLQSGRPSVPPSAIVDDASSTGNVSTPQPVVHEMNPLKGFLAVSAACLTSGLAGVYFEMVLKGSKADLWVRNVQLSLFSLLPALAPVLFDKSPGAGAWFSFSLFRHFNMWAWATVLIQVFGGLITAVVIKYSDNIMKGFATSLAIILSSVASIFLFDFHVTPSFVVGASIVLGSTAMYNNPDAPDASKQGLGLGLGLSTGSSARGTVMSPVPSDAPILGHFKDKKHSSFSKPSPGAIVSALGFSSTSSSPPSNGFSVPSVRLSETSDSDGNPYFKQAFSGTDTPFGGSTSSVYHSPSQPFPPSRPPSTRPSPRVSPPGPLPPYETSIPPTNHFIKMDESGNSGWRRD